MSRQRVVVCTLSQGEFRINPPTPRRNVRRAGQVTTADAAAARRSRSFSGV
jgi:hypothetical protein